MVTLKERKETDKKRVAAWRERQAKQGKKNISLVVSQEAYKILQAEKKKTGETHSAIIERALSGLPVSRHE